MYVARSIFSAEGQVSTEISIVSACGRARAGDRIKDQGKDSETRFLSALLLADPPSYLPLTM
jgi:hypothetical protein